MVALRGGQRVGVLGCGAVGTYFGARLAELGHDVRFLLRPADVAISLKSASGNLEWKKPRLAATPGGLVDAGEPLDWILVGVKSTALAAQDSRWLQDNIAPCLGPKTRLQFLMNGLGAEEKAAEEFGADRVHGGLVYGGFTRLQPGVVEHTGMAAEIRGGHFLDDADELHAAAELWGEGPHVKYAAQKCFRFAQWTKLCWNIPFNGLTVAAGGVTVHDVWNHPPTRETSEALVREVVAVANADLDFHKAPAEHRFDADATWAAIVPITDKMAQAHYVPSTTLDYRLKAPMEIDSIFAEPLRRAQALNIDTPRLSTLFALIDLHSKSATS